MSKKGKKNTAERKDLQPRPKKVCPRGNNIGSKRKVFSPLGGIPEIYKSRTVAGDESARVRQRAT